LNLSPGLACGRSFAYYRHMPARAGLLVIALAIGLVHPAAQGPLSPPAQSPDQRPPVTFRSEVNFVEIDAIVTDRDGRFVADLKKENFLVVEEGKAQAISTFSVVNIPVERSLSTGLAREAVEPDVVSNRQPFNGRIFMLLLDDLQTDLSRTPFVRQAVREFVERHVSDQDLVAITFTGIRSDAQDFTTSRSRLLAAVDSFSGTKLRSKAAAMSEDQDMTRLVMKTESTQLPQDPYVNERMVHAKASANVLQRMSEYLAGIRGRRKSLVYFGEGIDHELIDPVRIGDPTVQRDTAGVRQAMRDAVAAATRANVSVYLIDPRGLSTGAEGAIAMSTSTDPRSATSPMRLQEEMARSHLWMRSVAEETGGIPFLDTNDLAAPLARIVDDSSSHYILGYYAPTGRKDGRFRRVEIEVTRPGLQVRARKGYYAPGSTKVSAAESDLKTSAELLEAMKSPLPIDALTFAASAAPFQGTPPHAAVAVVIEIDPAKLAFSQRGGSHETDLELQISATDPQSKTSRHASHHVAQLRLRPATYETVIREGVRITRRLELRPGRYRLHIGVRDRTGGAIGTLFTDLDVPDFASPPLAVSGIVLVSAAATRMPTVEPDPALTALLPGDQTARREFSANDTLAVFAEIYDNDLSRPHVVRVTSSVRNEDGAEVFSARAEHQSTELGSSGGGANQRGGFGHRVTIPAATLPPGRYVLRVQARRSIDDAAVSREVPFRIE
jgi:VWFA-related protein